MRSKYASYGMKGKKHSEESKKKMSNAHKGKKYSKELKEKLSKIHKNLKNPVRFKKGNIPWNKGKKGLQAKEKHPMWGKHHSKKTKKTLSKKCGHKNENHWNWKGGVTPEIRRIRSLKEYKLWRTAVFERDNYTCIWCGQRGCKLNADHIKPFVLFPELRFAIDNGRTLCVNCHKKTDTYGRKSSGKKR